MIRRCAVACFWPLLAACRLRRRNAAAGGCAAAARSQDPDGGAGNPHRHPGRRTARTSWIPRPSRWRSIRNLSKIARARASDMAAKNYLAHAAPNGDTSRLAADGRTTPNGRACWAKIWRRSITPSKAASTVDEFAQRFLDEWMKSPPHRDNMAFANYDRAGVGAAVNGDTVYVAQLFSTDLGLPPPQDGGPASTVTSLRQPRGGAAPPPASRSRRRCGCAARCATAQ